MNATVQRNKRVGFTTNTDYFEKAKAIAKSNGMSMSSLMDMFVRQIALTGEIDLLDENEILFRELQAEVQKNIDAVRNGDYYTTEQVREELGL